MTNKSSVLFAFMACLLVSCEQEHTVGIECDVKDEIVCVNNRSLVCEKSSDNGSKLELKSYICVNGCDSNRGCKCANGCVNGCDNTGKCLCDGGCVNDCDEKGACVTCTNDALQCDLDNKNVQVCQNNKWESIKECDQGCILGECIQDEHLVVSTEYVKLLNAEDGFDKQIEVQYVLNEQVRNAEISYAFNENCLSISQSKMEEATSLTLSVKADGEECEDTELTLKAGMNAQKTIKVRIFEKNEDNNLNHLNDYYETASKQGDVCRKYSDCDSVDGMELGFCDSFIGYKCSTKCTEDSQCVNLETSPYHYVCRADGRCAPDAFEVVVMVEKGKTIHFVQDSIKKCDFTVDWGDGFSDVVDDCSKLDEISHTYLEEAKDNYRTIKMKGVLYGVIINNNMGIPGLFTDGSGVSVVFIHSFGPVGLGKDALNHAGNNMFDELIDIPDASKLYTMENMFLYSEHFNTSVENWDISNVKSLKNTFFGAKAFNQSLEKWDTSNVMDMSSMFSSAFAFNQPIDGWDTSKVTDMSSMFSSATSFNQPIGRWSTSNVLNMSSMFYGATSFNQPIDGWSTSNVTNMRSMFSGATSFNQPIENWDTSNVTNMSSMFKDATSFNQPIGGWNTSNVMNMSSMFKGATSFDQSLAEWDLGRVKDISSMFKGATSFNQDISKWNVWLINDMSSMFEDATSFNQDISAWKVFSLIDYNAYKNIFCNSGLSDDLKMTIFNAWKEFKSQYSNKEIEIDERLLECSEKNDESN